MEKIYPAEDTKASTSNSSPRTNLHPTTLSEYNLIATIGKGNFANVLLAEHKPNRQLYALKLIRKDLLIENDEVKRPQTEKDILTLARDHNHPFIIHLFSTFHTEDRLCFLLEYIPGGDLMHHMQQAAFSIDRSR